MDPFTALGSVAVTAADALHNLKKSRQECDRLRAEVEALKLERTAAELVHRETATTVLMQMAEVQRLRDAARGVCDRARASQWAAGEDALVPASRLDALLAALEGK